MTINVQENQDKISLSIEEEMTIYTALTHKTTLAEHLEAHKAKEIEVNLSAVEEMDSAGLQVLIFVKRFAKQHKIKVTLIKHSQAVADVIELLDLSAYFGDPIVIPADWS